MPKGVVPRSAAAAAMCLLLASCWPSGGAVILANQDGSGGSDPDFGLGGAIVVSGAAGAGLDLQKESEPNDRRGLSRRIHAPDQGVRIQRGVTSTRRRFLSLHGAGPMARRQLLDLAPGATAAPESLPAAHRGFAPDWVTMGQPGVLLLQAGREWTAELQQEHRPEVLARWQQPGQGAVRGIALIEDLLLVLVEGPHQQRLLTLDPWTGESLVDQTLGPVRGTGLAAARDRITGAFRLLTCEAHNGRLLGAAVQESAGHLKLGPFEAVSPLPLDLDLLPETLAFDGDLAWFLDSQGRAHGWCVDDRAPVEVIDLESSAGPAERLAVRQSFDRDAVHLVVPAGQEITLEWQAAADDLAELLVLDRTAGVGAGREVLVASRQAAGSFPQRHTLTLTAGPRARSFDLVIYCRSGAASWALVLGSAPQQVQLLARPVARTGAGALQEHDASHPTHWQHQATRHARPDLPDHIEGRVVVGERGGQAALPDSTPNWWLEERYRSPAGHRVVDLAPRGPAPARGIATFQGAPRPRAQQQVRARQLLHLLEELERHSQVAYAELVPRARVQGVTPNDPLWSRQRWAHARMNLPQAWTYTVGDASVVVAVVDSGIRTEHDDLAPVLLPGYDFVDKVKNSGDGDGMDPDPYDDGGPNSHGTHVAGTIAARGNDGFGISGVVMDGAILPIRAIGIDGTGDLLDVAEAIRYAAGLPNRSGLLPDDPCQVLNLSLGATSDFTPLRQAVKAALDAGVVVLAAAGNDGRSGLLYPAAYQRVVAVGASTIDDQRASYSNTGSRLDLLAPGGSPGDLDGNGQPDQVYSAMGDPAGARPGGFQYLMGTSMACAHASGVAALLKALKPDATPADIQDILTRSARDLGPSGFDASHGHGRLDALAAMQGINPVLSLNTKAVDLGDNGTAFVVQMVNLGGGTLTVNDLTITPVLGPGGWLTATALADGASIALTVDRTGLAVGIHSQELSVSTSGGDQLLPVTLGVSADPVPDVGTVVVEVLTLSGQRRQRMRTTQGQGYRWNLGALPKGAYQLHCGVDRDGDGILGEPGEPYGVYPARGAATPIQLQVRRLLTDLVLE